MQLKEETGVPLEDALDGEGGGERGELAPSRVKWNGARRTEPRPELAMMI